jgi:hypothetical protein
MPKKISEKEQIAATIDKGLKKKLDDLTRISGYSFSSWLNYLLKKSEELIDKKIRKYEKIGGQDKES